MHWFISIALGIVATLVSAMFGVAPGIAALIGLGVFVLYWVIRWVVLVIDGGDIYDIFDY